MDNPSPSDDMLRTMDPEYAVQNSREALVLLRATVSDLMGDTTGLAERTFASDLGTVDTARQAYEKAAGQLLGMLNISRRVLALLAQTSVQPMDYWLDELSEWLDGVQGGGSGLLDT